MRLWLMVVLSPLFLPFVNLGMPAVNIELFYRSNENGIIYEENSFHQKSPMATTESVPNPPERNAETFVSKPVQIPESSPINEGRARVIASPSGLALPISAKEILLLVWMLLALGMTARFAKGLYGLHSLRRYSLPVEDESIINLLDELGKSFSIHRIIQLATSHRLTYPVSFGWRKPIILMPTNFTDTMSLAEVRLTFIHEIAHFKRRDYLINVVSSFLRIPLFFHPLFILAQKQLQIQQEHICDDWVIQLSQKRTSYARCLLRQAEVAVLKAVPCLGTSVISGFKNMRRRIDSEISNQCQNPYLEK